MIERINYEFLPAVTGPYVHATKHGDYLYVSGLTAYGTDSQSEGLKSQAKAILGQLNLILQKECLDITNILKVNIFLTEMDKLSEIREVLNSFYNGIFPASSLTEVSQLINPTSDSTLKCNVFRNAIGM